MNRSNRRCYKVKKRKQKSTLLKVLETFCGILFGFALMLLIWDISLKNRNSNGRTETNAENTASTTVIMTVTPTLNLRIDQNATSDAQSPIEIQGVAIPAYKGITVPAGKTDVSVDFFNPESNQSKYYLSFELKVPDSIGTYETLYTSDLVEAGKHIYQITLSHALAAGVYEHSILHVQPYKVDGLTPTNNADVEFTLNVK